MGSRAVARAKRQARRKKVAVAQRKSELESAIESTTCAASHAAAPPGTSATSPGNENAMPEVFSLPKLPAQAADLSPQQQVAVAALVLGGNVTHTAHEIGVDRRTIQRWMKNDPTFHEVLGSMRQELIVCTRQNLLAIAESSIEMVNKLFSERPSASVALSFLRAFGVLGPQTKQALYNPPHVHAEMLAELDGVELAERLESATSAGEAQPISLQSISAEEVPPLSPPQEAALNSLAQGASIADSAARAQVDEAEVRHWLHSHAEFCLQLGELQFQRLLVLRGQLFRLMSRAGEIIRQAIQGGNARVALSVFRGLGMLG